MHRITARLAFLVLGTALHANPQLRQAATLVRDYNGRYPEEFAAQFDRVRVLVRQIQLDVSARLGLFQYREGFQYPMAVRFEDSAPPGIEHALAYVRLSQTRAGFQQEMVVNLSVTRAHAGAFDQILTHEMTHAVLNDAIGGEASTRVPPWIQEGLAQYVSGEGDARLTQAAQQFRRSHVHALVQDLNGPYTGFAYPQYYLAVKYMYDKHTSNAVQALVRNLIAGQSVQASVEDATGMSWEKFEERLATYSLEMFQERAMPDY